MKKKLFVLGTLFLMTLSLFAQDVANVPAKVVNELNKDFKNVNNVEWKTTDNYYKANFSN